MKRFLVFTLTLVLVLSLFTPLAYAADFDDDVLEVMEEIEEANEEIQEEIDEAVQKADYLMVKYADYPEILDNKLDRLAKNLVEETNEIAWEAMEEAAEEGIEVQCVLVEVKLGYKIVWIDPLVVVGW